MKVFDRLLGSVVSLPSSVQSGRYLIQEALVTLNGRIELSANDILFSDGGRACNIGSVAGNFMVKEETESEKSDAADRERAIMAIVKKLEDASPLDVSPLLPAELSEIATLLDLEKLLSDVLSQGHLQEIARKPRMNLRYEARITPLSRAKKISGNALSVLATRSVDWQKRTISGVIPKRVLALFSDDELLLYENKVFTQLLNRLDRHLRVRIRQIGRLQYQYDKAQNLNNSQAIYHALRTNLCTLWGQALGNKKSLEKMMGENEDILAELKTLKRQLSSLRESNLYRSVEKDAYVPEQLRNTNILQHDQHYRHLRPLWLEYQKAQTNIGSSPSEIFCRERSIQISYVEYIGLIIRRGFDDMPLARKVGVDIFEFSGKQTKIQQRHHCWHIELEENQLVFVPFLNASEPFPCIVENHQIRIPIFCHGEEVVESVEQYFYLKDSDIRPLFINPMGFYGEEKLRSIIEIWLFRPIFRSFAEPVTKIPKGLLDWFVKNSIGRSSGDHLTFVEQLSDKSITSVEDFLKTAPANEETKDLILKRIYALSNLGHCKVCGEAASFESSEQREGKSGFKATCQSCGITWILGNESGKRVARYSLKSRENIVDGFEYTGRWHLEVT
jgi:regulator of replication initiation timing